MTTDSVFATVELVPGDPILGLTDLYNADPRPDKVNLGVGIYYDEGGRIPLLPSVAEVEKRLASEGRPRGYLPIDGLAAYIKATQTLLLGADSQQLAEGRIATAQGLGGSGALRVGAELLARTLAHKTLAISRPSWENHRALFSSAGFTIVEYAYFDPASHSVDFATMKADLMDLQPGTVVLLHACCHNPTGADLSHAQWREIAELIIERQLFPFIDLAYQGFDRGLDADATAVRVFAEMGVSFMVANSYSKSFSLYGERAGALSVATANADEAKAVLSQIKRIIRTIYSNPATHGAALVAGVLGSAELRMRWEGEVAEMRERIHALRAGLVERLAAQKIGDFSFINSQAGMFSYSGLSKAQVMRLREKHAIYALDSGRINVAALNQRNLDKVAAAVAEVVRTAG